jgi:maltoporin
MEKLSANSKRGQRYINTYNRSTMHTLKDAYAKPSAAKQAAFKRCLQKCEAENGHNLRIISAGPWLFTVAFEVTTALGTTGLRVITREHDYLIIFGDKL